MLVATALSEVAYWLIATHVVLLDSADWSALMAHPNRSIVPHGEFSVRNLSVSAIVAAVILRYLYVQHQWRRRLESETRARIQALQSRIRPHFLFNSMNTIASLTRSRPEVAEQVTEDLAELFRESLGDASVPTTLEREFEICRQYLRIEQQRLGERLACEWEVDDVPMQALLPRLTLQPLVENAVYHGIEPAPAGGLVVIRAVCEGILIKISVTNPLAPQSYVSLREGNHIAQGNVTERLEVFFGGRAGMSVESDHESYRVELRFPLIEEQR